MKYYYIIKTKDGVSYPLRTGVVLRSRRQAERLVKEEVTEVIISNVLQYMKMRQMATKK